MFTTYDAVNFGKSVRNIRKSCKMTQLEVSQKTQLHIDTLRRIETGTSIPKYETLEALSKLFHYDFLEELKTKRIDKNLHDFYTKMDDILIRNNVQDLLELNDELRDFLKNYDKINYLINKNEISQLFVLIEVCQLFYSEIPENLENAVDKINTCLRASIFDFSITTLETHNYSEFEFRLLYILGTIYMTLRQYKECTIVFNFLVKTLSHKPTLTIHLIKLLIKIYTNMSYCYHLNDDHENALLYAKEGIAYTTSKETLYMLHTLYGRKSIAEINLQDSNAVDSYKKCIHLLEISQQFELAEKYKTVFKDKYNIDFIE